MLQDENNNRYQCIFEATPTSKIQNIWLELENIRVAMVTISSQVCLCESLMYYKKVELGINDLTAHFLEP